jgi:hypothetical protein
MYKICRRTRSFYVKLSFRKLDIYWSGENIANNIKALISFGLFCINVPIFGTNYARNMPAC